MAHKFIYTSPKDVLSPKDWISDLKVIYDGGATGFSIATMKWKNEQVLGIRWNLSMREYSDPNKQNGVVPCHGMPMSYTHPVWFILPHLSQCPPDVQNIIHKYLKF